MCSKVSVFKDRDGFTYKHPERNCNNCLNYPCVSGMESLISNFAAYGCMDFEDINVWNSMK